jgi:hypothetical protein
MKKRLSLTIIAALLLIHMPQIGLTQDTNDEEFNLIHWAFAPAFGTGVYRIGDNQEIYVLRLTPMLTHRFTLEKLFNKREVLLEFRFPLTFGIHNFDDIWEGRFPDRIRQISFTPGLELKLPMSSRWNLRLHGHLGYGSDTGSSGDWAWIYWGGIMSRLLFPIKGVRLGVINGYGTAGYNPSQGNTGDLSNLMNGIEVDVPIGKIGPSHDPFILKSHFMNFWYFDNISFIVNPDNALVSVGTEWEIGAALGKAERIKIWLFRLDRIGIGYRFGKDTRGIRIYFSSYFR